MLAPKLTALLDENHVHYQTVTHPSVATAQGMAAAMHIPGRELAKTVVIKVDGKYALAVLPGPSHVDLTRFREVSGARSVALASEAEFAGLFPGCELGAEPPFGELYGLPVWVDVSLARDRSIVFNGGTHAEAVRIAYADFERLAHAKVARFART
jgi:Ala-tRNA(Pro) deacylase